MRENRSSGWLISNFSVASITPSIPLACCGPAESMEYGCTVAVISAVKPLRSRIVALKEDPQNGLSTSFVERRILRDFQQVRQARHAGGNRLSGVFHTGPWAGQPEQQAIAVGENAAAGL